jgi:hypothetical protein
VLKYQVEGFLALALAQVAQVMESELELHVDLFHRKKDTCFDFRKPLLHTSYRIEHPS